MREINPFSLDMMSVIAKEDDEMISKVLEKRELLRKGINL
jgi:hypothetical protein